MRRPSCRSASTPSPAARSWPTSVRSTRLAPASSSRTGRTARRCRCGRDTCSIPTGRSRPCTGPRRPTSRRPTSCGTARRPIEAFTYFGFRYFQIDNPGEALGPRPGRRHRTARRHARRPGRDLLLGQPHAQRGVAADGALVPLLQPGAVRRHADPGEGAVHLGRRQRVRGHHAGVRRPEHELAGACATWRGARPATGPTGQVNAVYPNGDGARFFGTSTALYPEWVWRYYLSTGDKPTALGALHLHRQGGGLAVVGPPSRHRAALRAGRHQQRRSRLRLRPLGRRGHGQQRAGGQRLQSRGAAGHAGQRRGRRRALAGTGGAAGRGRQRGRCAGRDGTYVDGVDANGAQSQSRRKRPTRSRSPMASCRRPT